MFDVDDDEEMEELALPLLEQLQKRLEKFTQTIQLENAQAYTGSFI